MSKQIQIIFQMLGQILLFTVLAFCSFSVFAQLPANPPLPLPFDKLTWLNCDVNNKVQEKILYEYGAVYLSKVFKDQKDVIPCRFTETQTLNFAKDLKKSPNAKFSFGDFYLHPRAKKSFEEVAGSTGYQFFARNCNDVTLKTCILTSKKLKDKLNDDWALRTYEQTEKNWDFPAKVIETNQKEENITFSVEEEYRYDSSHPYYKKDDKFSNKSNRPKMYKVAIPGSSQHHLGLAIDVGNSQPRLCGPSCTKELMKNGWYRTVRYDAYHFTFLGVTYSDKDKKGLENAENELKGLGLKKVRCKDYTDINKIEYWVPDVTYKDEQNKDVPYEGYKNWECKKNDK